MADGVMPLKLDWLYLNPEVEDEQGIQWICTDCTGLWDSPEPRVNLAERVITHGAFMGPMYMKERVITIKGRAFAPDFATLRQAQAQVAGLCTDPNETYTLLCESEIGLIACGVRLDGKTLATPFNVFTPAFEFSIQVVAPDPRKYSNDWNTMSTGLAREGSGTGLDFAVADPASSGKKGLDFVSDGGLTFGASTLSGAVALDNRGTAPSAPIYTLVGPLSTPVISTGSDGAASTMRYNGELAAGETVVIDPASPSVLLGGTASRRHLLNPADFAGFVIPAADAATGNPGHLTIGLTHSGPVTASGYLQATYRDAWF